MDAVSVLIAPTETTCAFRLGCESLEKTLQRDQSGMAHSWRAAILAAHAMRLHGSNASKYLPISHRLVRSIRNARIHLSGEVLNDDMMLTLLIYLSSQQNPTMMELTNLTTELGSNFTIPSFTITVMCNHRSTLTSVCLSNCQVDDDCAIQLAALMSKESFFPNLKVLDVSRNEITDVGALALSNAILCGGDSLLELDLSRNQLSLQGMSIFVQAIQLFRNLRVLHLRDSELFISSSLMIQFCAAVESNYVLQTLSVGSEIMDGSIAAKQTVPKSLDVVDDLLYYCWQEPVYTAASNRIRFVLWVNYIGLRDIVQSGRADVDTLRDAISTLDTNEQTEAWYRIVSLKPDLLLPLLTPS